ncbi:protein of unassigned function [Methylobacterium oryzae CBMB20]|uniref:Protein of unassigned function n=1 Tax=Methylobacterium oryzae CBMB20 TaxID=693986 RepID=A0A089NW03_9HYPH|nr:protein of unassigned function [Methylobacterium oryzae CBMB20]
MQDRPLTCGSIKAVFRSRSNRHRQSRQDAGPNAENRPAGER